MFGSMFAFPAAGATSKKFFEVLTIFSPSLPGIRDCGGTDVELDFDDEMMRSLHEINERYVEIVEGRNGLCLFAPIVWYAYWGIRVQVRRYNLAVYYPNGP